MQAYVCTVCGYLYDVQSAERDRDDKLVSFNELDPECVCPVCSVKQDLFQPIESDRIPDTPTSGKISQ